MRLLTTDTMLHELERVGDTTRADSTHVRIPKAALDAIVRDHITLLAAARSKGHVAEVNQDQESLR